MHPILADIRRLLVYALAWLVVGVVAAALLAMTGYAGWAAAALFSIPLCIVFGFIGTSAYYVCRSLPLAERKVALAVAAFCGASLFAAFVWLALCEVWSAIVRATAPELAMPIGRELAAMLFAAGLTLYLLSILAHDVLLGIENAREAERRDAQSRLSARDAELQALRSQVNPHFLFNSLNSISALTTSDGAAARAMTIELAQFFRQTLALSDRHKIPLGEEIALCESFLSVEKIRFGDRLDAQISVDDAARNSLVPPMVLQPLVENAIKHGIRDRVEGGVIRIDGFVRDQWLHAIVENPVDDAARASGDGGVGLANLRRRFASLYGERARMSWAKHDGRFRVEITLPFESATDEAAR